MKAPHSVVPSDSALRQAVLQPTPVSSPNAFDILLRDLRTQDKPSPRLGLILAQVAESQRQAILSRWTELRFAVACHTLSEFPYQPAPIDSSDEPLFAKAKLLAVVHTTPPHAPFPAPLHATPLRDAEVHSHYGEYCKYVGTDSFTYKGKTYAAYTPRSLESWDSKRFPKARKRDLARWVGVAWAPTKLRCGKPYKNWCPNCLEYLPWNHNQADGIACEKYQKNKTEKCGASLTLAEVREREAERNWPALRELRRNPPTGSRIFEPKRVSGYEWSRACMGRPISSPALPGIMALENEIIYAERKRTYLTGTAYVIVPGLEKPVGNSLPVIYFDYKDLAPSAGRAATRVKVQKPVRCACVNLSRPFTFSDGKTIRMCPNCTKFDKARYAVLKIWKVQPPPHCTERYIQWRDQCLPLGDVEAWYAEWCDKELDRLGLTRYAGMVRGLSYFGNSFDVDRISTAREKVLLNGGKRVNKNSFAEEESANWSIKGQDRNAQDHRANEIYHSEQQHFPKTIGTCLYCGNEFAAKKGTKYCPGTRHRQRHDEQRKKTKKETTQ